MSNLPEPTIVPAYVGDAIAILKTARVATSKVNWSGFVQWKDRTQQTRAFMLFNEHSGQGPIFTAGSYDHSRVFNWLLQVAFESVQVGQLSTDNTPTMAFADPEE